MESLISSPIHRQRILFVAEAVSLAHVTRPLVLAQHLDPDRFDIQFACGPTYNQFLDQAGFTSYPITTISPNSFAERLANGTPLYSFEELTSYVDSEITLLKDVAPDLIVGDFRISLGISADLLQIPYVAIANAHWSPYSTSRFPAPELPVTRMLGAQIIKLVMAPTLPLIFRFHARAFNRLRRQYGLSSLPDLKSMYTHGSWTLYADLPSIAPTLNIPTNHRYIGPIIWSPDESVPSWWNDIPSSNPVAYITMGSSGDIAMLSQIVRAVMKTPYTALLSTAGRCHIDPVPGKLFVADYLPGLDAIRKSSLVICSGGSATAYQALSLGVPVLGLPSNADQFYTMEAIERNGAGILIRPSLSSEEALVNAVTTLVNDRSFKIQALKLAEEISLYDAGRQFSEFVTDLTATSQEG